MAVYMMPLIFYLTLTSVVFEYILALENKKKQKYLTLTSVVFEFGGVYVLIVEPLHLTLTSVVFEYVFAF